MSCKEGRIITSGSKTPKVMEFKFCQESCLLFGRSWTEPDKRTFLICSICLLSVNTHHAAKKVFGIQTVSVANTFYSKQHPVELVWVAAPLSMSSRDKRARASLCARQCESVRVLFVCKTFHRVRKVQRIEYDVPHSTNIKTVSRRRVWTGTGVSQRRHQQAGAKQQRRLTAEFILSGFWVKKKSLAVILPRMQQDNNKVCFNWVLF